jgi:hypothetical protein
MNKTNQKIHSVVRAMRMAIAMLVLGVTFAMAQTPNMINYQGVATNNAGAALANQSIKLRFKFHHSTATGTVQYSEVRTATTDATGQFSVQIGGAGATNVTGTWGGINWKSGDKFLQVEMDATGGSNFVNMGTQQLVSVPYAQYSKMAATLNPNATVDVNQLTSTGATNGQVLQYNGTNWVAGNVGGGGSLTLPYNVNDANGTSFNITNTNAGASTAIKGKADATTATGISGESIGGTAIKGYSNNTGSVAVYGSSLAGTGVKAYSYVGTALDVNGNLKISGGNTNPGAGRILTSDAVGNATWQPNVMFRAENSATNLIAYTASKVIWANKQYDKSSNFNLGTGEFTVPVSGVYNFCAKMHIQLNSNLYNLGTPTLTLVLNRNGVIINIAQAEGFTRSDVTYCITHINIATDIELLAGDKIYVEFYQSNLGSVVAHPAGNFSQNYFTGRLVSAN